MAATYWLGVIGSRRRTDRGAVEARIRAEMARLAAEHGTVGIVSGGARGPDTWAAALARQEGWPLEEKLPDLSGLGGDAPRHAWAERYYARNRAIAERCDELLAFVAADRRGGTEHTVRCARALRKGVSVA